MTTKSILQELADTIENQEIERGYHLGAIDESIDNLRERLTNLEELLILVLREYTKGTKDEHKD